MAYENPAQKKFLDFTGLSHFAQKLNDYPDNTVIASVIDGIQDELDTKVDSSSIGARNGIASLDSMGKVSASQLPSDILVYVDYSYFPLNGAEDKLYIDETSNIPYYWSGESYVAIGGSISSITNAQIDALFV